MLRISGKMSSDRSRRIVNEDDADFDRRLTVIAEKIADSSSGIKAIMLSGPTCSGKSTAAVKLSDILGQHGKKVHTLSIDDYYLDRDILFSRTADGSKLDLDSPDTIDLSALALTANEIYNNDIDEVDIPVFDFLEGKRTETRRLIVDDNDVFIFEGIQALYPQVTSLFDGYPIASVFINVSQCICVDDVIFPQDQIRLMRRLVRDYYRRGATASYTFQLWGGVRENEEVNIFPYADNAGYSICSAMRYEMGMLKPHLEKVLTDVGTDDPAYSRASELLRKLGKVAPIDAEYLSNGSLYHEFI